MLLCMWKGKSFMYFLPVVYVYKKIEKILNDWTCEKNWKFVRDLEATSTTEV
jgi:hypothetical protein